MAPPRPEPGPPRVLRTRLHGHDEAGVDGAAALRVRVLDMKAVRREPRAQPVRAQNSPKRLKPRSSIGFHGSFASQGRPVLAPFGRSQRPGGAFFVSAPSVP